MDDDLGLKPYTPRGSGASPTSDDDLQLAPVGQWKGSPDVKPEKSMTMGETALDTMGGIGKGLRDTVVAIPGVVGSAIHGAEWVGDRARTGFTNTFGVDPAKAFNSGDAFDPTGMSMKDVGDKIRNQREAYRKKTGEDEDYAKFGPVPLPTTKKAIGVAKDVGVPDYEPKGNLGRAAQTITGLGAGVALGPGSWAQKAMMTADGYGLGWLGDKITKNMPESWKAGGERFGITPHEMEESGKVIGTGLGLGVGARSMQGMTGSEDMKNRGLSVAADKDARYFEANPRQAPLMTPQEIARARELGIDVPNWSTMGPNQRRQIQESAKTPQDIAKVEEMNRQIGAAGVDDIVTGQRPASAVIKSLEDSFGGQLDAGDVWLALRDHMKEVNGQNYRELYNLPHAQQVWSPELERLYNTPRMKPIIEKAQVLAAEDGNPITAPAYREPQGSIRTFDPATQSFTESPAIPGGFHVPDGAPAPNIAFHDYVRKALNDEIDSQVVANGYKHNTSSKSLKNVRDAITGEAETQVPEWGQVRSKAADLFGKEDALDYGPQLWKKSDTFTAAELRDTFRNMSQDEQHMAQYSLGTVLRDEFNNNLAGTVKKLATNRDKIGEVLGRDYVDGLILEGKAAMQRAKATGVDVAPYQPRFMERARHIAKIAATPAAWTAPAMAQMGEAMLGAQPWAHMALPAVHAVSGIAPFTLAPMMTHGLLRNAIARPMINRARSKIIDHYTNPTAPLRLPGPTTPGPAMPRHPDEPSLNIVPERARGGELGPAPRGKVNVESMADQLVKMVEQARASVSGETEHILGAPDTHVVQALHVAKHALG